MDFKWRRTMYTVNREQSRVSYLLDVFFGHTVIDFDSIESNIFRDLNEEIHIIRESVLDGPHRGERCASQLVVIQCFFASTVRASRVSTSGRMLS